MFFNSVYFAIFLIIVFFLYWFIARKSLRSQNILLLVSSYFFYACWDWRFLFLLAFSTALDFYTGIKIAEATQKKYRKLWLWISIGINLGFLGFFKYYNFFIDSFQQLAQSFHFKVNPGTLEIILPVGISFYTFHGLSYVIDMYYGRMKEERNFVDYSVFVSFFPLLVAGPIERATHLLPQIKKPRTFDYAQAVDGMRQILWGLFKKIVIADNCAEFANAIFNNPHAYSGSTLLLGAVFFAFQIYGDFSGYSDIAIGTARLFSIDLLRNFAFPYFSRDIAEFWRRWHISLSTWFRDYVYIPLGGSKGGMWMKVRNTFIIFIVSGFWHGANWTFIVWGVLNALYIMPLIIFNKNRTNLQTVAHGKIFPSIKELISIVFTFGLTTLAWIFFRADSVTDALQYLSGIFSASLFKLPAFTDMRSPLSTLLLLIIFIVIEWSGRENEYAIAKTGGTWPVALRRTFYYSIIVAIFYFQGADAVFIYFQF